MYISRDSPHLMNTPAYKLSTFKISRAFTVLFLSSWLLSTCYYSYNDSKVIKSGNRV